jgi:hypothetical protein
VSHCKSNSDEPFFEKLHRWDYNSPVERLNKTTKIMATNSVGV